jgi:hypothetical protein
MFMTSLPRRFFTPSWFPHCIGEGGGLLLWDKKEDKAGGWLVGGGICFAIAPNNFTMGRNMEKKKSNFVVGS